MFGNEEITKKISKDLNLKINFCLFEFLIEKIYNEDNKIDVYLEKGEDSTNTMTIKCGNDKKIFIQYYFYGFLLNNKKFYHFSSIIKKEFRKEIFENQIKSINFYFYNDFNNIISDNLIHDKEFPLTKNKSFTQTIFFSFLNTYIRKHQIFDQYYKNIIENNIKFDDKIKYKDVKENEIFVIFNEKNKYDSYYIMCSFNNKNSIYALLENMTTKDTNVPDIFENKEFLNNDFSLILGCTIAQNLISFDSFIDRIIEINSENKERYEELIEFKKSSDKYRKHDIFQYLTIEDIEKLILE